MFKTITSSLDPKKTPTYEELQKIQPFVFCRWLSGNPITILAAAQLNYYYDIPIENQYMVVKSAFAGKIKYIPYPKKDSTTSDIDPKVIDYLCDYFKINQYDAKEYLELISTEELKKITEMYKNLESSRTEK